jgi:hypothetical protein
MHVWPWSITFLLRGTSLLSCTVQTNAIPQLNALSHLMPFVQPSPQQPGSTVPLAPSRTSSSSTNRGPVLRSTSTYRTAGQGPQGAAHLPSRDSMRKRAVTAAASVIGSAAAAAVPTQLHHHYQVQQAGGGDEGRSAPATKVNRHQHHHYQSQQQLQCHEDQHDNLHQQQQQAQPWHFASAVSIEVLKRSCLVHPPPGGSAHAKRQHPRLSGCPAVSA